MFRLALKDIEVARLLWIPALFLYILFISTFLWLNLMYLAVSMLLCFLLILAVPFVEDKQGLDPFLCSLPVKRADVVRARYLSAGVTVLVTLALLLAAAPLAAKVFDIENAGLPILYTPAGILSYLLPLTILLSLYFPLYFKLGLGKSLLALMAAILVLAVMLAGAFRLAALLFRKSMSELFPFDAGILSIPYKPFLPLATSLREAVGEVGFFVLLIALFAGMVALSLRLSVRYYQRREL